MLRSVLGQHSHSLRSIATLFETSAIDCVPVVSCSGLEEPQEEDEAFKERAARPSPCRAVSNRSAHVACSANVSGYDAAAGLEPGPGHE